MLIFELFFLYDSLRAFFIVSETAENIFESLIIQSSSIKYEKALAIPQFAIKSGKTLIFWSARLDIGPKKISSSAMAR